MHERIEILKNLREGKIDVSDASRLIMETSDNAGMDTVFYQNAYMPEELNVQESNPPASVILLENTMTIMQDDELPDMGLTRIVLSDLEGLKGKLKTWDNATMDIIYYMPYEEIFQKKLEYGIGVIFDLIRIIMEASIIGKVNVLAFYGTVYGKIPEYEAIGGFGKCIRKENPNIRISVLGMKQAPIKQMLQLAVREVGSVEQNIHYGSDGERQVLKVSPVRMEDTGKERIIQGGTYIITGGLGGVGRRIAAYMSDKSSVNLVFVGRKTDNAELQRQIASIIADSSKFLYICADVSKQENVRNIFAKAEVKFGSVQGVIHCAGVIKDSFFIKKEKKDFQEVLAPKVLGTHWLYQEIQKRKDAILVLFSSNSAVFGNASQSDYAYANAFMDSFARNADKKGQIWSINWPYWQDGGMHVDFDRQAMLKLGLAALGDHAGCRAFHTIVNNNLPQTIVMYGNSAKISDMVTAYEPDRPKAEIQVKATEHTAARQKATEIVKSVLEKETKMPALKISTQDVFEKFGIDSLMITDLIRDLEEYFGELSKTLFFEYGTVGELAEYLALSYSNILCDMKVPQDNMTQKSDIRGDVPARNTKILKSAGIMSKKNIINESLDWDVQEEEDQFAIIGMSVKMPKAENLQELWNNLKNGVDAIEVIPEERWDYRSIYSSERGVRGKTYAKWGGFISDVDKFDPLFFHISPLEARIIDPQERLFLENTWHLFEDAGYTRERLAKQKVGVYVGIMYGQYQILGAEETQKGNPVAVGSTYASIANRVSYFYDLTGPSMAVDTMCSSSLTALQLACESMRSGECKMAVIGGVNLSIHPSKYLMLSQGNFASSDGRCRSFGEGGDGYVPGEGIGSLLIKPLNQAKKDKDKIWAVIRSGSINHGGKTNGYTVPNPAAQTQAVLEAIMKSGINPRSIGYVEAHGTGTKLGDPIEITALTNAFRKYSQDNQFCAIGSVKSNIGHLEAAAGIAGIAKTILQLKYNTLVPSLHSTILNANIHFEQTPFYVQQKTEKWEPYLEIVDGEKVISPRRACINALGAGGSNAHFILEEYIEDKFEQYDDVAPIVVLSATNQNRLKELVQKIIEFIHSMNHGKNKNVSYLTNVNEILHVISDTLKTEVGIEDCIDEIIPNEFTWIKLTEVLNRYCNKEYDSCTLRDLNTIEELIKCYVNSEVVEMAEEQKVVETSSAFGQFLYLLQRRREPMEERLAFCAKDFTEVENICSEILKGSQPEGVYRTDRNNKDAQFFSFLDEKEKEMILEKHIQKKNYKFLALLWANGEFSNWDLLYDQKKMPELQIPDYPFARERCWVSEKPVVNSHGETRYYRRKWKNSGIQIRDRKILSHAVVLVNPDGTYGYKAVAPYLEECICIIAGKTYSEGGPLLISGGSQQEWEAFDMAVKALNGDIQYMADLTDLDQNIQTDDEIRFVIYQQIVTRFAKKKITMLHFDCEEKGITEKIKPEGSVIFAGFSKMLSAEYNELNSKNICVDHISLHEIPGIVETEANVTDGDTDIYYQNKIRKVAIAESIEPLEKISPARLREDGLYVITGGTRGIGADIGRDFVRRGAKHLIIMGEHPIPPRDQWDRTEDLTENDVKKIRLIQELEQNGADVSLYFGKLTESDKLNQFITEKRRNCGPVRGIVHCAGLASIENPAFIKKNMEQIKQVFEPKIQGLHVLHEIFLQDHPDFFLLFSSISAVSPKLAVGLSDYSVANYYMDEFARDQHKKGYSYYQSVNWPNWKQGGMGQVTNSVYSSIGLYGIDMEEGIEAVRRLTGQNMGPVVIPIAVDDSIFNHETLFQNKKMDEAKLGEPMKQIKTKVKVLSDTKNWLKKIIAGTLMLNENQIDDNVPFGDYGVDSILVAELVRQLEKELNEKVEPSMIIENQTVSLLAAYIDENYHSTNVIEIDENAEIYDTQEHESSEFGHDTDDSRIAVIGMACNFPQAENIDIFWDNLRNGRDCITEVSPSRWNVNKYYSDTPQKGKSISKWGGFIKELEYFDPEYFKINKNDAPYVDPSIRLMLQIVEEVMRDAGYDKKELWGKKVSLFAGARMGQYGTRIKDCTKNGIIGAAQNFITAYASHVFNFKGTSIMLDTACSSAMVGLHLACQNLLNHESEISIVGGVDILLDEKTYLVLSEAQALSPDGKCHTFDAKANGFVPGEGCGAVMLKRYDKAIRDGDKIYAVINSTAVNNDGHTMGATTPNPDAQYEVIKEAIEKSGIEVDHIGYIETHGTGTMIGDPIELKALTKVFRDYTDKKIFCGIGSVKTNIGHLMSAAGISGFIKVVLSLYHKQIPPTLNCNTPNPRFDFQESPFYPVNTLQEWNNAGKVRIAGISAFGFGGTNTHAIISCFGDEEIPGYVCRRNSLEPPEYHKDKYWIDPETPQKFEKTTKENSDKDQGVLSILDFFEE